MCPNSLKQSLCLLVVVAALPLCSPGVWLISPLQAGSRREAGCLHSRPHGRQDRMGRRWERVSPQLDPMGALKPKGLTEWPHPEAEGPGTGSLGGRLPPSGTPPPAGRQSPAAPGGLWMGQHPSSPAQACQPLQHGLGGHPEHLVSWRYIFKSTIAGFLKP